MNVRWDVGEHVSAVIVCATYQFGLGRILGTIVVLVTIRSGTAGLLDLR